MQERKVTKIFPNQQKVPISGLYLEHKLKGLAHIFGGRMVLANYICDRDDIIATKDDSGEFQVAKELKNKDDWDRFQELTAQADIIITGSGYLQRFAKLGEAAENVIDQFDKGGSYEYLGDWRLENGYRSRNPDLAIVSRSLDFDIPDAVTKTGRKIIIYTTTKGGSSDKAKELSLKGVDIVNAGTEGVDGKIMIDDMQKRGYKVIKMTTGPRVLEILLKAEVLDRLYITRVDRKIEYNNESDVTRILFGGGRVAELKDFRLVEKYLDKKIITEDGRTTSQEFLVYQRTT